MGPGRVVALDGVAAAGRYALRLSGPVSEPTSVGVRVAALPVDGR